MKPYTVQECLNGRTSFTLRDRLNKFQATVVPLMRPHRPV